MVEPRLCGYYHYIILYYYSQVVYNQRFLNECGCGCIRLCVCACVCVRVCVCGNTLGSINANVTVYMRTDGGGKRGHGMARAFDLCPFSNKANKTKTQFHVTTGR